MGLSRYNSRRVRFTWRGRSVNRSADSQKVLLDCKDQRKFGGKCAYFSACTALAAHRRLQTGQPCPELSWRDLENKVVAFPDPLGHVGRMRKCFIVLMGTGVCCEDSEDIIKIKDFESVNTKSKDDIDRAVRTYMKKGPMLGTFEVISKDLDLYGKSEGVDAIYVAFEKSDNNKWTHSVTVTGFGIQGIYPFWEFQNTFGPAWRGAARGFGQIYAIHLRWLYGFRLV